MESLKAAFLESWDRQAGIVASLANYIQPEMMEHRSAPGESCVAVQLCHIQLVRRGWLSQVDEAAGEGLPILFEETPEAWIASRDLEAIRAALRGSAAAIRQTAEQLLESNAGPAGPYTHPVHFVQHMVWHEGWHVGAILAALRQNGCEPSEEWEEKAIWEVWRGPETG